MIQRTAPLILIPFDDYKKEPDAEVRQKMTEDRYTNILFTGRIVPNKRQEDVIATFYHYHKYYNPKSRLILIGNYTGMESYYESLQRYIDELGAEDIIFPGHISFPAILAYYATADLFLCMSDHEGFCVPLVEAMNFEVPVLAKNTTAIPYTLGGSGMMLEDNDPLVAATAINRILTDTLLSIKIRSFPWIFLSAKNMILLLLQVLIPAVKPFQLKRADCLLL